MQHIHILNYSYAKFHEVALHKSRDLMYRRRLLHSYRRVIVKNKDVRVASLFFAKRSTIASPTLIYERTSQLHLGPGYQQIRQG
jgi:hypothetical protein